MSFLDQYFYNDISYLPYYAIMFIFAFIIIAFAVYFHEFGHYLYFRKLGKRVKIYIKYKSLFNFYFEVGEDKDYEDLTDKDYKRMLLSGIISGAIPIVLFSVTVWSPYILLLLPYGIGSLSDLNELFKDIKLED